MKPPILASAARRALTGLLLCASLVLATSAVARPISREDEIDRARAQLEALDYTGASETAEALLKRGGNGPEALRALHQLLGWAYGALGRVPEAKRQWRRLLALEPDYRIDARASPKIRRPLAEVLSDWAGRPGLTVLHRPPERPRSGKPLRLAVEVIEDPLQMVQRLRVVYRPPGVSRSARFVGGVRSGQQIAVDLPIPAAPIEGGVLRYHLELLDRQQNIVARLGSAGQPYRLAETSEPSTQPTAAATPTPWYRRWWVWTLAGVVVAGATAAAVVAATSAPERSDVRVGFEVKSIRTPIGFNAIR
jgi:tetratricopeptide (TPR) repeat protein